MVDQACRRLVTHLNRHGATWGDPEPGGEADRWRLHSSSGDRPPLDVRVVRELEEAPFWGSLAQDREVVWTGTASALAELVRQAILRASVGLPSDPEGRSTTVLLLLAGDASPLTLTTVAGAFRSRHAGWARGLRLHGIWMVGDGDDLVLRLDDEEPARPPGEKGASAPGPRDQAG